MIVYHPGRARASFVVVLRDGERLRFHEGALEENTGVNQYRSRLLRRGNPELAPPPHALGKALLEAEEASLTPELKVAAKQQRCLENLLTKSKSAKRGRPVWG